MHFDKFQLLTDAVHFLRVNADALDLCSIFRCLCVVLQGLCECHATDTERVHDELLPVTRVGSFFIALREVLELLVQRQNLTRAVREGDADRL